MGYSTPGLIAWAIASILFAPDAGTTEPITNECVLRRIQAWSFAQPQVAFVRRDVMPEVSPIAFPEGIWRYYDEMGESVSPGSRFAYRIGGGSVPLFANTIEIPTFVSVTPPQDQFPHRAIYRPAESYTIRWQAEPSGQVLIRINDSLNVPDHRIIDCVLPRAAGEFVISPAMWTVLGAPANPGLQLYGLNRAIINDVVNDGLAYSAVIGFTRE